MNIIPATENHAIRIAPFLRTTDIEEIQAATGDKPVKALIDSVNSPGEHWSVFEEDVIIAMLGISELSLTGSNQGIIWLVGTNDMVKYKKKILSLSRSYINVKKNLFDVLFNYVDVRNKSSIRWLGWLGFDVQEAVPFGVNGEMFHRFELRS